MKKLFILSLCFLLVAAPNLVSASLPGSRPTPWTEVFRSHWKSRTAIEKKELKQSIKTEIRNFQKAKKQGREADTNTLLLVLISLILPPLAVYLHQGEINSKFWISLLLTLLVWVPGVVYALLVIFGVVN